MKLVSELLTYAILGFAAHVALWGYITYVQECCG